jgi:hypothetical protein
MVFPAARFAVAAALLQNWMAVADPELFTYMFPLNWLPAEAQQTSILSDPLFVKVTSSFQVSGFAFPSRI